MARTRSGRTRAGAGRALPRPARRERRAPRAGRGRGNAHRGDAARQRGGGSRSNWPRTAAARPSPISPMAGPTSVPHRGRSGTRKSEARRARGFLVAGGRARHRPRRRRDHRPSGQSAALAGAASRSRSSSPARSATGPNSAAGRVRCTSMRGTSVPAPGHLPVAGARQGLPAQSRGMRFESSPELSDRSRPTPAASASSVCSTCAWRGRWRSAMAMPCRALSPFTVATEDYPLSRRLFFYLAPTGDNHVPANWSSSRSRTTVSRWSRPTVHLAARRPAARRTVAERPEGVPSH